jgi:hypothetical protein
VMAQLIAKRVLIFPLINKDLRDCYPLFARGNFASDVVWIEGYACRHHPERL